MKTKNILIGLGIFLFLIVGTLSIPNVSAYECNPSGCPSGYQDRGIKCEISGLNYVCKRECYRPSKCGSYGGWSECASNYFGIVSKDQGKQFVTSTCLEDSNHCYIYKAEGRLSVTDWNPGFLGQKAESLKLTILNTWNSNYKCINSPEKSIWGLETISHTLGRGSSGSGHSAAIKYQAYRNTGCSGSYDGVEGGMRAVYFRKTAPWIEQDTTYKTCSGIWDCKNGDTKCERQDYYSCRNHEWQNEGKIVGKCGVECESDYDCSSSEMCKDYKCIPNPCYGVTCEDKCQNSVRYSNGYCESDTGECSYDTKTCEYGCLGKFCAGDPCKGVICDDKCENSIWKHDGTHTVIGSRCECKYTEDTCQYGCKNEPLLAIVTTGMCRSTPCEGVTCPDYCSSTSLFTDGKCINGKCTNFKETKYSEECGFVSPWKKWYVWVGGVIFIIIIIFGIRYWRKRK